MGSAGVKHPKFFNCPNSITLFRYFLVWVSWHLKGQEKYLFWGLGLYTFSCLLDLVDGYVSHKTNQNTLVGDLLDQFADRATTLVSCFDVVLVYPEYKYYVYLWVLVDVFTHWVYKHSCVVVGNRNHKNVRNVNFLLTWYYTNKVFMFLGIVATEVFWVAAYCYKTLTGELNNLALSLLLGSLPFATFRTVACVLQGYYGFKHVLDHEKALHDKKG